MIYFLETHLWLWVTVRVLLIIFVANAIAFVFRKLWHRNPKNHASLSRKLVFYLIQICIYFGALLAIGQIQQLSQIAKTILTGSGIFALALSLAAQESLNNIISGVFITLFKTFEVGDRVTLVRSKITGNIEDITLRHTIIKTFTNTRVVIPNATINTEIIENSNIIDSRSSAFVDVLVAYESDIDLAMKIMADVIGNHPNYLDIRSKGDKEKVPKVKVYVRDLADSGIALRANMWTSTVDENFQACSDARLAIKKAFDAANIEIPYTKYTIVHQETGQQKNV